MEAQNRPLPKYVQQEFDEYLRCVRLEHVFLRVSCESCHDEKLVAFSCKRRGFCPSCGARRMADSAALLVDDILPEQPIRQRAIYCLFFLYTHRLQHRFMFFWRIHATHHHIIKLVTEPCKCYFEGGPTPGKCVQAMVKGHVKFTVSDEFSHKP